MQKYFNRKTSVIVLATLSLVIITLIIIRIFYNTGSWVCVDGQWVAQGEPATTKPSSGCQASQTVSDKHQPETTTSKGTQLGIWIIEPKLNAKLGNNVTIKGTALKKHWSNQQMDFKIINKTGKVLSQTKVKEGKADNFGNVDFETSLTLKITDEQNEPGYILINNEYRFPINL